DQDNAPWFARSAGLINAPGDPNSLSVLKAVSAIKRLTDPAQETLLRYVTRRLFNYILIDLLALYFGFNRNLILISHLYWGYFIQNSTAYKRKCEINKIHLISFMLRILWIHKILGAGQTARVTFGDREIDKLFGVCVPILEDFTNRIFEDELIT